MATVGRFQYAVASHRNDARLHGNPHGEREEGWTHDQIWALITQDGKAADPRDVDLKVEDPKVGFERGGRSIG